MLGKLIKHEFIAVSKILIILHVALLIMTLCERILLTLKIFKYIPLIGYVFTTVYILSLVAVSITTFIYLIYRFYKNLFTDEGYLMHTLPVSANSLLLSKLLVAFCWCLIDTLVFTFSIIALFISKSSITALSHGLAEVHDDFVNTINMSPSAFIFMMVVFVLIALIYSMIRFYSAIAIGHLFGKHKLLGAFGAYVVIYIIIEIITTVSLFILGFSKMLENSTELMVGHFFTSIFTLSLIESTFFIVLLYFVTQIILKKKTKFGITVDSSS